LLSFLFDDQFNIISKITNILDNNIVVLVQIDREFVLKIKTIRIANMIEIMFNVLFRLRLDVHKDDNCNIELSILEGYVFIKENNDNRNFPFNYDPNSKITKKFKYHRITNDKIIFEKTKKIK